jgi:hypothetical protein
VGRADGGESVRTGVSHLSDHSEKRTLFDALDAPRGSGYA